MAHGMPLTTQPGAGGSRSVSTRSTAAAPTLSSAVASAASTIGRVRYMQRPPPQTELFTYLYEKPGDLPTSNMQTIDKVVEIHDIRQAPQSFTLRDNGFQLEQFQVDSDINWDDAKEVEERYYPAVDALLKRVTGGTRTHIFDHTLRRGKIPTKEEKTTVDDGNSKLSLELPGLPVSKVHVDYTVKSGVERLHRVLPEEAEKLQKTPFAVIQVWRPLVGPVQDSPLAMIDVNSLAKDDYMSYTLYFPGRTGYNYTLHPDNYKSHRWYYTKEMTSDEAYVFTCYDSRTGRARFTPHTGFFDPHSAPDAPPRQSIEIRAYVFWENEEPQTHASEL